jgi:hypothetical protein
MQAMDHGSDERYASAKKLFAEFGYFCRGSVLRRMMPCGKAGCRCQATPPQLHGPYYQWTRKVRGKTVTVRLSPAQVPLVRRWLAEGRRFDALARRAEALSLRAITRSLREAPGTP